MEIIYIVNFLEKFGYEGKLNSRVGFFIFSNIDIRVGRFFVVVVICRIVGCW